MRLLLLISALLVVGCSPQLRAPHVAMPDSYIYALPSSADSLPEGGWWLIFGDSLLDGLERQALAHNRDLQASLSRVIEAHHAITTARAALLPTLSVEFEAEGERQPPAITSHELLLAPSVAWQSPLLGYRHTSRQARAEYMASEWAYRAMRLTLTHTVATTYFSLIEAHQQLAIARQSLALRRQSLSLIDSMARYGFASGIDLEQARSMVSEAEADVVQYSSLRSQAQLSLSTLLGTVPQPDNNERLTLPSLPRGVPTYLPSELLSRRPDLMEAHYNVVAAAAKVGIAHAARFPSLSLTGQGGVLGENVKELFTHGQWAWSLTASVTQPLFAFGRLRRGEQIAREEYRQTALQYEQAVLQALEEVEKALLEVATTRQQAYHFSRYVEQNTKVASLQQALYERGMSNYLDVISVQQTWYASQQQYVQLLMQQYQAMADLVLALGDGWQQGMDKGER